jgi:hypothetical protein
MEAFAAMMQRRKPTGFYAGKLFAIKPSLSYYLTYFSLSPSPFTAIFFLDRTYLRGWQPTRPQTNPPWSLSQEIMDTYQQTQQKQRVLCSVTLILCVYY